MIMKKIKLKERARTSKNTKRPAVLSTILCAALMIGLIFSLIPAGVIVSADEVTDPIIISKGTEKQTGDIPMFNMMGDWPYPPVEEEPLTEAGDIALGRRILEFDAATGIATIEQAVMAKGRENEDEAGTDVLLVLDDSASMTYTFAEGTKKWDALIKSANTLAENILSNSKNTVALISYSGKANLFGAEYDYDDGLNAVSDVDTSTMWIDDIDTMKGYLNNLTTVGSGGTDIQAALIAANNLLLDRQAAESGRKQILIMICDGNVSGLESWTPGSIWPPLPFSDTPECFGYSLNTYKDLFYSIVSGVLDSNSINNVGFTAASVYDSLTTVDIDIYTMSFGENITSNPMKFLAAGLLGDPEGHFFDIGKTNSVYDFIDAIKTITKSISNITPAVFNAEVTIDIPENFTLVSNSIKASPGTDYYTFAAGSKWSIIWEIGDVSEWENTLTYKIELNPADDLNWPIGVAWVGEAELAYAVGGPGEPADQSLPFPEPVIYLGKMEVEKQLKLPPPGGSPVFTINIGPGTGETKIKNTTMGLKHGEKDWAYIMTILPDAAPRMVKVSETAPSGYKLVSITPAEAIVEFGPFPVDSIADTVEFVHVLVVNDKGDSPPPPPITTTEEETTAPPPVTTEPTKTPPTTEPTTEPTTTTTTNTTEPTNPTEPTKPTSPTEPTEPTKVPTEPTSPPVIPTEPAIPPPAEPPINPVTPEEPTIGKTIEDDENIDDGGPPKGGTDYKEKPTVPEKGNPKTNDHFALILIMILLLSSAGIFCVYSWRRHIYDANSR